MPPNPRILVGVCTYNEAGNIESLLTRISDALPTADILVVDDNSPDGTANQVDQFAQAKGRADSIRCLIREQRGLGGAIRAAMMAAIDGRYDLFCNLDADLSHDPADLPRLVAAVEHGCDVAVGSRYVADGEIVGWPLRRKWMSRWINLIARRRLGLPVKDASGSFRCYRVSKLAELDLDNQPSEGYSFLQEVLLKLHQHGATFKEVPITFTERTVGDSKLDFREAVRSGWTVFRLQSKRS
ncbi:polyprenol monophosphomannose synthase [Aporhodopirellula aestuarii]|uniref:Polyprenol monophosphomannose synthase n=1 Tax=Aporhodopirellula aestuarii TaxID=2950107 RepID=A0ABT0U0D0_9BACT|nr:polyprenol monophosphomannose synthase [Aporhodopirellula aestuarii]MCM2370324.1 polyprenol monophosphomannose synthase [Aporhodopirellula aestuarii]